MEESRRWLQVGTQLALLCSSVRHHRDRSAATVSRNLLGECLVSLGIKELKLLEKQLDSSSRHNRCFFISLVSRGRKRSCLKQMSALEEKKMRSSIVSPNFLPRFCNPLQNRMVRFATLSTHLIGNQYLLSIM
uniref:Uncharacterized protein n=1 Tax=Triticum urartu TaxID=4572 RepID=A0A8R7P1C5_TRIUA